ncbi:MAG: PEP/pyruvate-binding domain-containing protein [Rikenellaceae bacterium]
MNSIDNRTDIIPQLPHRFMRHRVHKILLVCCSYDGYILEEDGHIESQINREYSDLNLSNPPSFTRVSSTAEALELLAQDNSFDFVITMYNIGVPDVFTFARMAKEIHPNLPITLMTSFSVDIYSRLNDQDTSSLDSIFCWMGNTDLIIAIIKLIEDQLNAEEDIERGNVQAILLVEDSVRFYSTYLPELYRIILNQSTEFLRDAYNEQQQVLRKRARPKILLATNYEDALKLYQRYKKNILGVISDVGFALSKDDAPSAEKHDAGLDLCRIIKKDNPLMPVLLQSSQTEFREQAEALGAGFVSKYSKRLVSKITRYIEQEFAFGDLVLTDPDSGEEVGRAHDLNDMQHLIATIPERAFQYHTSQNHLSKWLYARGLFPLAASIRSINRENFDSVAAHRAGLVARIRDYRTLLGQGVIASFDSSTYSDVIAFARMGSGSIGGKARGLAFMNSSIINNHLYDKFDGVRIMIPRTVVVATDYFDEFIRLNGLEYIISSDMSDEIILSEFINSELPHRLRDDLKHYIRTVNTPLAIRSSSKLEDSHYQPFAGIYSTYMIPYTDNEAQMLRMVIRAIKSVYASVYFAASKAYITTSQNMLSEEKMAVILQRVCGTEQEGYYMPTFSGVARSINCYPIGDERSEEGVCNVAMGLGKLVVDGGKTLRFSPRHPRKVLQTSTDELALSQTQNEVLALNLSPEKFRTSTSDDINIEHIALRHIAQFRHSNYVCSTLDRQAGRLSDSPLTKGRKVITFNSILKYNSFPLPEIITDILKLGEEEMRCPVEVEFAVNMDVEPNAPKFFNLLQIRPIVSHRESSKVDWSTLDCSSPLIYAQNALGTGHMEQIHDVIYINEETFSSLITEEIADELLHLNAQMQEQERDYILIGMGRWGSSDPFLGVPVKWGHISNAKVIVEQAIDGFDIEPSQGTHFFQNVTSLGVGYITMDCRKGVDKLNVDLLNSMEQLHKGKYLNHVRFEKPLQVIVDGVENRALVRADA